MMLWDSGRWHWSGLLRRMRLLHLHKPWRGKRLRHRHWRMMSTMYISRCWSRRRELLFVCGCTMQKGAP